MSRPAVGVGLLVLVLSTLGCSAAASTPDYTPPGSRTVTIDVRHSRFSESRLEVPRGTRVHFVVNNKDPIPHELIVGDQATQDRHEYGTESHHGERDGEVSVAAGSHAETSYTFSDPGPLMFGCHLPGHWAYGMQGTIVVT